MTFAWKFTRVLLLNKCLFSTVTITKRQSFLRHRITSIPVLELLLGIVRTEFFFKTQPTMSHSETSVHN